MRFNLPFMKVSWQISHFNKAKNAIQANCQSSYQLWVCVCVCVCVLASLLVLNVISYQTWFINHGIKTDVQELQQYYIISPNICNKNLNILKMSSMKNGCLRNPLFKTATMQSQLLWEYCHCLICMELNLIAGLCHLQISRLFTISLLILTPFRSLPHPLPI